MAVKSAKKSEFPGMKGSAWGLISLERQAGIQEMFGLNGAKASRAQRKKFGKTRRAQK